MTASSIGTYLDIMGAGESKQAAGAESVAASVDVEVAAKVLTLVLAGKGTVEEIATATGLDATEVLATLVKLSNAGVVELTVSGAEVRAAPSETLAAIANG